MTSTSGTTSTTATGDAFRDQIVGLLRIAGYAVVVSESLTGHKKLDIRFEETVFGRVRRYALEAKNYRDPLDKDDIAHIVADYLPLIQNRQIDELLIVSPHQIRSAAANTYLESFPQVGHRSFLEFQESIMGFQGYLRYLIRSHEEDGLEHYYIAPTLLDGSLLEERILAWLNNGAVTNPIAILAGYGMGKTSFARHLAHSLAVRALAGTPSRIPILLSLGSVSREQSLEGLVGSALSGKANLVTRYSFELFSELNRMGRFVCFLDGFDEMKHMMSPSEFRHNFTEINRLVDGRSRVILLGRPTAFLSGDEREYVLRGRRPIGDQWTKVPGAPQYEELHLAPFTPEQTNNFIIRYFKYWQSRATTPAKHGQLLDDAFVERRRAEIQSADYAELISRPVHARMLAEIATDPNVNLQRLSRFTLYNEFIGHLITREAAKEGRRGSFGDEVRRRFAAEMAWQLWTTTAGKVTGCRIEDLPSSLFKAFTEDTEDINATKRDLVSGSFLEEKTAGVFYIPHRSFQEFLVAERISRDEISAPFLIEHYQHFNKDVVSFLAENPRSDAVRRVVGALQDARGQLSVEFMQSFRDCSVVGNIIMGSSGLAISPWHVFLSFFGAPRFWDMPVLTRVSNLLELAGRAREIPVTLSAILCLVFSFEGEADSNSQILLFQGIARLLMGHFSPDRFIWAGAPPRMILDSDGGAAGSIAETIVRSILRSNQKDSDLSVELDLPALYGLAKGFLSVEYQMQEFSDSGEPIAVIPSKRVSAPFASVFHASNDAEPRLWPRVKEEHIDRIREYFIARPRITTKRKKQDSIAWNTGDVLSAIGEDFPDD